MFGKLVTVSGKRVTIFWKLVTVFREVRHYVPPRTNVRVIVLVIMATGALLYI